MKIYIASDHGGFDVKNKIVQNFKNSHEFGFVDLGPFEVNHEDDYPDFAKLVTESVSADGFDVDLNHKSLGILICKSGNGMVIAANKIKGAYASLCFTPKHSQMARLHDNSNILCLDSEYSQSDFMEIVEAFLVSKFEGAESRHGRRFRKVLEMEVNTPLISDQIK